MKDKVKIISLERVTKFVVFLGVLCMGLMMQHPDSVFASTYSVGLTTSGTINIDVSTSGIGAAVATDNLVATSTCPLGYTITIQGPTDTNLYKDGSSSNNNTNTKIAPSAGTIASPLPIAGDNGSGGTYNGTWGYSLTSSTSTGTFIGLNSTSTNLVTKSSGSSGDGNITDLSPNSTSTNGIDTIPVYYGVSTQSTQTPGLYTLPTNSTTGNPSNITYFITTPANCTAYTVEFNSTSTKGGTSLSGTSTMNNQTIAEGVATNLNSNTFTAPTGYSFDGWNTKQDGTGTHYADKASVTDLTTANTTITLYAEWKANDYNITYDYQEDYTYTSTEALDTGYYIDWSKDFTIEETFKISTLGKRYLIIGNYNTTDAAKLTGLNIEVNTSNQLRLWMSSGDVNTVSNTTVPNNTDVTIVYSWDADTKSYGLVAVASGMTTINMNGTCNSMPSSVAGTTLLTNHDHRGTSTFSPLAVKSLKITAPYTYGNNLTNLPTVSKAGFTIDGWFTAKSGGIAITSSSPVPAANTTYYAMYRLATYNLVITGDSYVSAMSVKAGSTSGTETTCTKSGTTFTCSSLTYGTSYYLYPTFASGYEFSSWTKTDSATNASLGSTSTVNTYYKMGAGAGALTLASKKVYMQDLTATQCSTLASDGNFTVYDRRDESDYTVRYLQNACWMTQNLRLTDTVSSQYSNFSTNSTFNPCYNDLTAGNSTGEARCHDSGSTETGVWYNYASASAGTITGSSNDTLATEDICPAGWHLPSYDAAKPAGSINSLLDLPDKSYFSPVTGGDYYGGNIGNTGNGYWWSSIAGTTTSRYYLYYNGSSLTTSVSNRYYGLYIRCVRE